MLALLFPGQGAQFVGMGKEIYQAYPEVRYLFDQANEVLGFKLTEVMFEGPLEKLNQTKHTQLAVFCLDYLLFIILRDMLDFSPDYLAGHSLGELAALAAAGAFSFSDGLRLVKARAELMERVSLENEGGMVAILGVSSETAEKMADETGLVVANYNSPQQTVLSGLKDAINQAFEVAPSFGARVVKLKVAGPFHSPYMKKAAQEFELFLKDFSIEPPLKTVISNVTAKPYTNQKEIKDLLVRQVYSSVKWVETLEYLKDAGVEIYVEVGPGTVLSGLVKKTFPGVKTLQVNGAESLEESLKFLGKEAK
jgi:[acyl-carrier-protein] S-malonyltransferase